MPSLKKTDIILGADISGTNTTIGLFRVGERRPVKSYRFKTKHLHPHTAIKEALTVYSASHSRLPVKAGIAVAAPIDGARIRLTNAPWTLTTAGLRKAAGCPVKLINDFEAQAYGLSMLTPHDRRLVRKGHPRKDGARCVLGAGTGLGEALAVYDPSTRKHRPLPTEGGHRLLPARSAGELELAASLKRKLGRPPEYEDVLSGRGLERIYDHLLPDYQATASTRIISRSADRAAAIAQHRKHDPLCRKAFQVFLRFYARFIRDAMLSSLPHGGLYISGGISLRNQDAFTAPSFRQLLIEETRSARRSIGSIPIYLITTTDIGMKGAAAAAQA